MVACVCLSCFFRALRRGYWERLFAPCQPSGWSWDDENRQRPVQCPEGQDMQETWVYLLQYDRWKTRALSQHQWALGRLGQAVFSLYYHFTSLHCVFAAHWCMHMTPGSHLPSRVYRWAWCKDSWAGLESVWCDQSVPCSLSQVLLRWLTPLWCTMLHPRSCSQAALHHGGGLQGTHAKCVSSHIDAGLTVND